MRVEPFLASPPATQKSQPPMQTDTDVNMDVPSNTKKSQPPLQRSFNRLLVDTKSLFSFIARCFLHALLQMILNLGQGLRCLEKATNCRIGVGARLTAIAGLGRRMQEGPANN